MAVVPSLFDAAITAQSGQAVRLAADRKMRSDAVLTVRPIDRTVA